MPRSAARKGVFVKKRSEGSRFYRACYAMFSKIVGWIFRITVINSENEPDEGGFLVCSNHIAASDAVIMCYAFRKHQVRLMAKKELFKIPLLASLIKMLGAFPVDRSGSDVGAIKKAVEMLKENKCVGIFPQGHRHPGVEPRTTETKNGAALISTRAEADMLPIYIWRKNNKPRLFRKTYVIIGERIPFDSLNYDASETGEYKRITDIVFDRICALGEGFDHARTEKEKKK